MPLLRCLFVVAVCLAAVTGFAADEKPAPRTDAFGDPLPEGARLRIGTVRFRQNAPIQTFAVSSDGKVLATVGAGKVNVWDVEKRRETQHIEISEIVHKIEFVSGTPLLAVVCTRAIRLYDVQTGAKRGATELADETHRFFSLAVSADGSTLAATYGRVNGTQDLELRVWQIDTGREFGPFAESQRMPIALSRDGKRLASYEIDKKQGGRGRIQLRELPSGRQVGHANPGEMTVTSFHFTPDERTLMVASPEGIIDAYETATMGRRFRMSGPDRWGLKMVVSPDGGVLACGAPDGGVYQWDTRTGKRISTTAGPRCNQSQLVFSPAGRLIAFGRSEQAIVRWDVRSGEFLDSSTDCDSGVYSLAFGEDGKVLLAADLNGRLNQWSLNKGQRILKAPWIDEKPPNLGCAGRHVVFAPDGKSFVTASDTPSGTRLWDYAGGRLIAHFPGMFDNTISPPAFSVDGKYVAAGGGRELFRAWDTENGEPIPLTLVGEEDRPGHGWSVAFSRKSKYLVGGSRNGPDGRSLDAAPTESVRVWEIPSGKEVRSWTLSGNLAAVAFTPDEKAVVVALDQGVVQFWDLASGKKLRELTCKDARNAFPIAFSPDGRTLAVGFQPAHSEEGRVHLWDWTTGASLGKFVGHHGAVQALSFSPDGKSLASGSEDTTILIWDLGSLTPKHTP